MLLHPKQHTNGTALILSPGASLNRLNPYILCEAYDCVVGMNYMMFDPTFMQMPNTVVACHHTAKGMPTERIQQAILDNPGGIYLSEWDCFDPAQPTPDYQGKYYTYRTFGKMLIDTVNYVWPILNPDAGITFAGSSGALSAIGLAIALGYKNIHCAGIDGGMVDGRVYWSEYEQLIKDIDDMQMEQPVDDPRTGSTFGEVQAGHFMRTYMSFKTLQRWINANTDIELLSITKPADTAGQTNQHTDRSLFGNNTDRQ
jgi:hypothetical protein